MDRSDVIGQSALLKDLRGLVDSGRGVHSYIFHGPKGGGKRTISSFFAKMILCREKDKPCGYCKSCRQFDSGNHPDVIKIKDNNKGIRIEAIREMREEIGIKPFQGEIKVYIIEDGDTMNPYAQNALLKTLEEPPEHSVIIILAENVATLLPTIVSRCQRIRVPRLTIAEMATLIKKEIGSTEEEAQVFAGLSQGLPGRGLELARSKEYKQMRQDTLGILERLSRSSLSESISCVDYFMDNRDNIVNILDNIEQWLRDLMVFKYSNGGELILNKDKLTQIHGLSQVFTTQAVQYIIDSIEDSKRKLKAHANFQLTIENLLIRIQGSGEYAGGSRSKI